MQPQQLQTQKLDNILYQLSRVYRDQAKVRKDSLDLLNTNPSFQFITGNLRMCFIFIIFPFSLVFIYCSLITVLN